MAYYTIGDTMPLSSVLVFLVQAGFTILEAGLNPVMNTVHILFKSEAIPWACRSLALW